MPFPFTFPFYFDGTALPGLISSTVSLTQASIAATITSSLISNITSTQNKVSATHNLKSGVTGGANSKGETIAYTLQGDE